MAVNVYPIGAMAENLSPYGMLSWVNKCLQTKYSNIEELCTGAAYCQFMSMLFPGTIPVNRVKFHTNSEQEYIQNFKLLQAAFKEVGVNKTIPIEILIKGNFQENLQFLQWFKKFFDANNEDADHVGSHIRRYAQKAVRSNTQTSKEAEKVDIASTKSETSPLKAASETIAPATNSKSASLNKSGNAKKKTKSNISAARKQKLEQLSNQVMDIRSNMAVVEKERDFYLSKLRDIEILCQEAEAAEEVDARPLVTDFLKILHATKDGFVAPD